MVKLVTSNDYGEPRADRVVDGRNKALDQSRNSEGKIFRKKWRSSASLCSENFLNDLLKCIFLPFFPSHWPVVYANKTLASPPFAPPGPTISRSITSCSFLRCTVRYEGWPRRDESNQYLELHGYNTKEYEVIRTTEWRAQKGCFFLRVFFVLFLYPTPFLSALLTNP